MINLPVIYPRKMTIQFMPRKSRENSPLPLAFMIFQFIFHLCDVPARNNSNAARGLCWTHRVCAVASRQDTACCFKFIHSYPQPLLNVNRTTVFSSTSKHEVLCSCRLLPRRNRFCQCCLWRKPSPSHPVQAGGHLGLCPRRR